MTWRYGKAEKRAVFFQLFSFVFKVAPVVCAMLVSFAIGRIGRLADHNISYCLY